MDDQSTNAIISAIIRHMSRFGRKNFFLSDHGSGFLPLANKFSGDHKDPPSNLPPLWVKLLQEDFTPLEAQGGFLWVIFSKSRHEAVSRVEKYVGKIKHSLERSQLMNKFKTGQFTFSELETHLALIVT